MNPDPADAEPRVRMITLTHIELHEEDKYWTVLRGAISSMNFIRDHTGTRFAEFSFGPFLLFLLYSYFYIPQLLPYVFTFKVTFTTFAIAFSIAEIACRFPDIDTFIADTGLFVAIICFTVCLGYSFALPIFVARSDYWDGKYRFLIMYAICAIVWIGTQFALVIVFFLVAAVPEVLIRLATGGMTSPVCTVMVPARVQNGYEIVMGLADPDMELRCYMCMKELEPREQVARPVGCMMHCTYVFHPECLCKMLPYAKHY